MEKISFVIPCYRSALTLGGVVDEIKREMSALPEYGYEIILVNDHSPDNVWSVICELCSDSHIIGVNLARNFGQPSAVLAGFSKVSGDYVITLDDDGQSPLDAASAIIRKLKSEDLDVVYGVCKQAKFSLFRRIGSKLNSLMASYAFNRPKDRRIIFFCIYKRYVIEEIKKYKNAYPYMSGLVYRSTANIGYLDVDHRKREIGTSGYSMKKLIGVWMNGLTAFSNKPLRIAAFIGAFSAVIGFIMGVVVIIRKIMHPEIEAGWSSTACLILFLNGINFLISGLMGEYVGRIYMSINSTPQYIIRDVVNDNSVTESDDPTKG